MAPQIGKRHQRLSVNRVRWKESFVRHGLNDLENVKVAAFHAQQSESRLLDIANRVPIEVRAKPAGQRRYEIHEDSKWSAPLQTCSIMMS